MDKHPRNTNDGAKTRTTPEPQSCPDHPDRTEMWCWEWKNGETSDDAEPVCVEGCDHPEHRDPFSDCFAG